MTDRIQFTVKDSQELTRINQAVNEDKPFERDGKLWDIKSIRSSHRGITIWATEVTE